MSRIKTLLVLALAPMLAGAAPAPVLTLDGFGALRIGMTRAQVEAVEGDVVAGFGDGECLEATIRARPGVALMFLDGRLARVSLDSPDYATRSGVRVGTAEARAIAIYRGRLSVRPHYDFEDGHELLLFSRDGRRALRLETDGGKVLLIHAGEADAAQLREGCI